MGINGFQLASVQTAFSTFSFTESKMKRILGKWWQILWPSMHIQVFVFVCVHVMVYLYIYLFILIFFFFILHSCSSTEICHLPLQAKGKQNLSWHLFCRIQLIKQPLLTSFIFVLAAKSWLIYLKYGYYAYPNYSAVWPF